MPGTFGAASISICREGFAENRRYGEAVLRWLAEEKLIDEAEREQMDQAIQGSTLLFPHQAYDLILRSLLEGEQEHN